MKKYIVLFLVLLAGCGGPGGAGGSSASTGAIVVKGNIYNQTAPAAAIAAVQIDTTAERLPSISASQMITVSTEVINQTSTDYSGLQYEVLIEDDSQLRPETWVCNQWFRSIDGMLGYGNGVWSVAGNALTQSTLAAAMPPLPLSQPPLSTCDATYTPLPTSGYCVDTFPPGIDCSKATYSQEYSPPGDGLSYVKSGPLILAAGQTFSAASGMSNGGIGMRPDHIAQWIVYDKNNQPIASKKYLFDVVQ